MVLTRKARAIKQYERPVVIITSLSLLPLYAFYPAGVVVKAQRVFQFQAVVDVVVVLNFVAAEAEFVDGGLF